MESGWMNFARVVHLQAQIRVNLLQEMVDLLHTSRVEAKLTQQIFPLKLRA